MALSKKEFENVSKLNVKARYHHFIKRVADFDEVFTLVDAAGAFAIAEVDDKLLIPLWPAYEYALLNITQAWEGFKIKAIPLEDEFIPETLDQAQENGYLFAVFPTQEKIWLYWFCGRFR